MQYKVINNFIDKNTGELYKRGSFFNAQKDRADELIEKGFLEKSTKTRKTKASDKNGQ